MSTSATNPTTHYRAEARDLENLRPRVLDRIRPRF